MFPSCVGFFIVYMQKGKVKFKQKMTHFRSYEKEILSGVTRVLLFSIRIVPLFAMDFLL